jgi:hypothetical protein
MKLIYTNENRFIVSNIRNIIQNSGIETQLKNEYIAGAAGDLAPLDTWLEIWVKEDKDYNKAIKIIKDLKQTDNELDWVCDECHELNHAAFEICWQCQAERPLK